MSTISSQLRSNTVVSLGQPSQVCQISLYAAELKSKKVYGDKISLKGAPRPFVWLPKVLRWQLQCAKVHIRGLSSCATITTFFSVCPFRILPTQLCLVPSVSSSPVLDATRRIALLMIALRILLRCRQVCRLQSSQQGHLVGS